MDLLVHGYLGNSLPIPSNPKGNSIVISIYEVKVK